MNVVVKAVNGTRTSQGITLPTLLPNDESEKITRVPYIVICTKLDKT